MNIKKHETWELDETLGFTEDTDVIQVIKEIESVISKFIKKWQKRKDYLNDPKVLKEALDDYNNLDLQYGKSGALSYYFSLKDSLDSGNKEVKAKLNLIDNEMARLINNVRFFTHNISQISQKEQGKFLKSKLLSPYHTFIKKLFIKSKYLLSEKEENLITLLGNNAYGSWVDMLSEFLSNEETYVTVNKKREKISFSETINLLNDSKPTNRDNASKAFNKILNKNKNIAEHEMNNVLNYKKIIDELRGYTRPDESRHISDDVPTQMVDTLRNSVEKYYYIANRYYELKAKILNVDKLKYHERNIEIGKSNKQYKADKAVKIIDKVFTNLDSEFSTIFNNLIESNSVDFYPRKGKRHGAFCTHNRMTDPTYILLNYSGNLDDIKTMAHEMGHAINNEMIKKNTNEINFGTPTSTAEVASTFMEDFVLEELIKNVSQEEKLNIMMSKLNDDISTIFRQIAFYNFELELHNSYREKGYLDYKTIGDLFLKHMSAYMGHYVEQSRGSNNWWIYVPHFRYYFYVYSYSSGQLISKSLQRKYREDKTFIKSVKQFLSTGLEKSVTDIFTDLGIDILNENFWNDGLDEIEQYLLDTEALAIKLNKFKNTN